MTKLYLAGPMRGKPYRNYPAFMFAAMMLRRKGFEVVSPAENDLDRGVDPLDVGDTNVNRPIDCSGLAYDFKAICDCDGIVLMPGWEQSMGAKAERFVAEMTGKHVFRLDENMEVRDDAGNWKFDLSWKPTEAWESLRDPV